MKPAKVILIIFLGVLLIASVALASCISRKNPQDSSVVQNESAVVVSEIMTSNTGSVTDAAGNQPDYVEFYNKGTEDLNISGYSLSDREDRAWIFPDNTVIKAGGYLLVWCTGETVQDALIANFKLSTGDVLRFTDAGGSILLSMEIPSVYSGYTLSYDFTQQKFVEMLPSPLYPNTEQGIADYEQSKMLGDSPLSVGSTVHNGVYISEFMASNSVTTAGPDGSYPDWIELYNNTASQVDLSGCGISDDESKPYKYTFPEGTVIEGNQYLVLWCTSANVEGYICVDFSLSGSGESLVFSVKAGGILDIIKFDAQQKDYSMARSYDGVGNFDPASAFAVCDKPTPGYPNTLAGYDAFDQQRNPNIGVHDISFSEILSEGYRWVLSSKNVPTDEDLGSWVELYNASDQSIDLSGFSVTDNEKNPVKWVFPNGTSIAGKGYLILYMSGSLPLEGQSESSVTEEQKAMTLSFSVAASGETLYLFDPSGTLLDRVTVPQSVACVSYAKGSDGTWGLCETPTKGAANTAAFSGSSYCGTPVLSLGSGLYHGAQSLTITVPSNCYVTYTLDCTTPTKSSTRYNEGASLNISANTVIRAKAFSQNGSQYESEVVSNTYIIVGTTETTEAHDTSLNMVYLVTDPDNLWNKDYGIYVVGNNYEGDAAPEDWTITDGKLGANFNQSGREWERSAHMTYLSAGGQSVEYETDLMIRIFGAFSRKKMQKGVALVARKGYGSSSTIDYPFFSNRPFESYKSLVLRASGQDCASSRIRDVLVTGLADDGNVDLAMQAYVQVVVYLNGEYWGVYNLREKVSKYYLAQHYGVTNEDSIDVLVGNGNYVTGDSAAVEDYKALISYCESKNCDLSNAGDYAYVASQIDVENYALYCALEICVGNTDTGNIKFWRSSELDNKWRWIVYDFCYGMNRDDEKEDAYTSGYRRDFFTKYFNTAGHGANKGFSTVLSRSLLKNNDFVEIFLKACAQMTNEVYSTEKILAKVDELSSNIAAEMEWDFPRWGLKISNWKLHLDNIRGFAKNYPANFLKYCKAYINANTNYNLTDEKMLEFFGRTS